MATEQGGVDLKLRQESYAKKGWEMSWENIAKVRLSLENYLK